jgi:simple sugar transport system substrate-binding protein
MKYILFFVLSVIVLTACAPAAPAATDEPVATEEAAGSYTYEDLVIGFIQTGSEGGWRAANTASFKETAEELGINLKDRRIDADEDLYVTYIGSDFVEEGRKSADEMCKLLEGSESKNVVELVGNVGSSAAKDRGQGFRERMGECGITIVQSQTANWNATEGKAVMEAWLNQSTDIQGVFAQNDEMGLGAIEAIREAGLDPGEDIKILSVDATAGAFNAMIAGDLNVTVECNPLLAPQVYEAALAALNGESLPKWVPSQEGVFYAEDAAEILPTRKY